MDLFGFHFNLNFFRLTLYNCKIFLIRWIFLLFNSNIYIFIFLPTVFLVYFYLNRLGINKANKIFLVSSSLFFYSWWNIAYLPIMLASIFFNYYVGIFLSDSQNKRYTYNKKYLLVFGIISNILLLGYFKYTDFFIGNLNYLLDTKYSLLHMALPLGISFFTFQQIAYLVDSYKSETAEYNFLNYANFVTFFPQLIAGPIVHHKEMIPQFSKNTNKIMNYNNIATGLFIFSIGLFKKVVIADTFSLWATTGFDVASHLNFIEAWATSLSYTFQIYFDFSAYTDMAIGSALLFNIKLPINFNSPYKAVNIQDFWRRWHITLSRFLRDYVYIPLGGNRQGNYKIYVNLLMTFVIGGIWHGAGWTFIFWGLLHGTAMVIHKIWNLFDLRMNSLLAWFITFNFINITWIFFRAKEWNDAIKVLWGMINFQNVVLPEIVESKLSILKNIGISFGSYLNNIQGSDQTIVYIIISFILVLSLKNSNEIASVRKRNILQAIFVAVVLFYSYLLSIHNVDSQFLYFNF